ncbi:MAG TPA: histidine kinase [Chitinophagaceae bacterium]
MQKYTVNDGLSDSYILGILQDSEGFLWVGSINGLSRFDGREFINYGYAEGLPSLRVDQVYEDHNKRIWAGTRRGMVEIRGGKCIAYPTSDSLPLAFVFGIKELGNHDLLAMTDKGVYRFDRNHWQKLALYPGMENQCCRNIVETGAGLLINYGDRVVLKRKDGQFELLGAIAASKEYYDGITVFNKQVYLHLPDRVLRLGETDTVSIFAHTFQHMPIRGFFMDSKNRCWVTTEHDGILVTAPGNPGRVTDTLHTTYNLVSGIYEDREGNIWIACIDGLMKVREVNYSLYRPAAGGSDIRNIIKTDGGIVACSNYGLLECRQGVLQGLPLQGSAILVSGRHSEDIVDDCCTDDRGRQWLTMRNKHLYLLDHHTIKDMSALVPKPVRDIYWQITFNQQNRKLYLCSDSLFEGNEKGFVPFRAANSGQYILRPRSVYSFSNGLTLVYTADNAFFLLDAQDRMSNVSANMPIGGASEGIRIYAEPTGRFWLAYNGGLLRFHWNEQQQPVRESMPGGGLPRDAIHGLAMDAFHRLWALTRSGLVVIEPGTGPEQRPIVHRLSEEAGIYCNQWIGTRIASDDKGAVWMSLQNSLYRFDPAGVQFDNTSPAAAMEDIQLNLHPTQWGAWADSLYGYRQLPRQVQLPYYLNNLSLSYKAPCFHGASGIEFSYELEGADSGWSNASKDNSVSFVRLPPGNYTFRVRARKSNTEWGAPAAFAFTINSPYWERWWFRACILALATALLAFIFRSRIRQVRRKAQVKEQLRELELKALRAQMNPHFIYNALNSIQALVFSNKPEEASLYISKFGRLLRQVLNHSEQPLIPLQEELEALELYIQLEQLRLHVDLQYSIRSAAGIDAEEELVPPLLLQPFAENALWHGLSRKQGEKKLDITVTTEGEWLVICVADNGIGRLAAAGYKPSRTHKGSRGMDITGRRLQEYNRVKDGVFIGITDLYDAAGAPAGTSVVLRIQRKTGAAASVDQQTPPLNP